MQRALLEAVGGHDRAHEVIEPIDARRGDQARRGLDDALDRQRLADDARRSHQHALLVAAEGARGVVDHGRGVERALVAGAGVGVAAVDDDRARRARLDVGLGELDRRGAHAVLREHRGGGHLVVGDDEAEVGAARGLDARDDAGELEAGTGWLRGGHATAISPAAPRGNRRTSPEGAIDAFRLRPPATYP